MSGDTIYADLPGDDVFREVVRRMSEIGYGRMAQIVFEEWRRVAPESGGLKFLCPKCKRLYIYDTYENYKKYRERLANREEME